MARSPDIRIGISGWRYARWRGRFYPKGLAQRRELEFASREFSSIELNGSFYSLQRPEHYRRWHDDTPDGFVFAVKGPRYLTHMLRLKEPQAPLANFFASGLFELRGKLGPILWQLPPMFAYNRERLETFFEMLPRDTTQARKLALKHDARMDGRTSLDIDAERPLRHALEIRHESFRDDDFVKLLRKHGIGLVVADAARRYPLVEDVTADFVYIRLHGDEELYASGYSERALADWSARIDASARGEEPARARKISALAPKRRACRDVYCYFDNDAKVHAPFDAKRLIELVDARRAGKRAPKIQLRDARRDGPIALL